MDVNFPMRKTKTYYYYCSFYKMCKAGVDVNPFCGCAAVIRSCIFKEIDERSFATLLKCLFVVCKFFAM